MLPNGLLLCLDRAVHPALVESERGRALYLALAGGLFREDVWVIGGVGLPAASVGHVWPLSRRRCATLFARAVAQAEDPLAAAWTLGRAIHVLADMACPAHALAAWHGMADPYERFVEAHAASLAAEPLPEEPDHTDVRGLVDSLAGASRRFRADPTGTPWGRALWRAGRVKRLPSAELADQARTLVPAAGAHVRALLRRFEREVRWALEPLAPAPGTRPGATPRPATA